MRKRTECTGFRAKMTENADATRMGANIQKNKALACIVRLLSYTSCRLSRRETGEGDRLTRSAGFAGARCGPASGRAKGVRRQRPLRREVNVLLLERRRQLSVRRIHRDVARQLPLPTIAVGQQSLLIVIKLLARLG